MPKKNEDEKTETQYSDAVTEWMEDFISRNEDPHYSQVIETDKILTKEEKEQPPQYSEAMKERFREFGYKV